MPNILMYRAIAQNNTMFLKLLLKHNPGLINSLSECDKIMGEYFSPPIFSFINLANGSDKRIKEVMEHPLYHEIITIIVQIYNAYCFDKFNYDQGVGICWGLLPTLIVSMSKNQEQLLENLHKAVKLTVSMHASHKNSYYDSGCLLTVENYHQDSMKKFISDQKLTDTVLGVIYTDTNYIVSGCPSSLNIIMTNDETSKHCKYIDAVRYPLHNPHHNKVTDKMYEDVDKGLIDSTTVFHFPVIDLENGLDITQLPPKELYMRMFELFAVLPNDLSGFMDQIVNQPDSKIYDLGCGGNNGIVKLLQKSLEGKDCQLFNYQFDKCQKDLCTD